MKRLSIHDFLEKSAEKCTIDVRSEEEFLNGHITNSLNMPLFNNEERAKVGTTYKKVGKQEAIIEGLEIVGPKMATFVQMVNIEMQKYHNTQEVFIYCWRGGMRSGSVGWLLETAGFKVYVLEGGYKSYRQSVIHFLQEMNLQLKVLSGSTGSGKTELLKLLQQKGEQVIDLEGLANHKGSAFGALGQEPAPTQESFDTSLYDCIQKMDLNKSIWIENESKNIGRIYLPPHLVYLIQISPVYNIYVNKEERIERLVKEYAIHDKHDLVLCLEKIKKRLGGLAFKDCIQALEENDFKQFTELVLFYYDRTYEKHLNQKKERIIKEIEIKNQNYQFAIEELLA